MAEKKETKAEQETKVSKADELVTVYVPRLPNTKEDKLVVINGKRYIIKRGEQVQVPRKVAEVLHHEQVMQNKAYEYEEQLRKRAANKELT